MWGSHDETQQLKLRQIDSLKQYFSNVKEIQRESLFEIAVSLPNRKTMTIRLTLPRDFPKVPPSLQVFPPVQHRLVDSQMLIIPTAHENLSRWSVHASLGKTVYEIIQKFMQDPPLIANTVATPTPGTTSPYPYPTTSPSMVPTTLGGSTGPVKLPYESKPLPQTPDAKPQTHIPLPVVPATFPELESKTPNELSQLLSDDAEFQKFFEALPQVQTMKKLRDDLRDNNESLAKKNLEREQEIEGLRAEVGTKVATITERRASFNQKAKRQQEILEQFSTPALIEKLTDAAATAEEESDNLARRFLNGEVDQKDFVKEFMEKRKLYHLRSAKKESLAMIVR